MRQIKLSQIDKGTLCRALQLKENFDAGIFPVGGGQWSHFYKLARMKLIEFSDFGFDIDGEVDRDVAIFQLTPKGLKLAQKVNEDG